MKTLAAYSVHGEAFKPLLEEALKSAGLSGFAPLSGSLREVFLDTFDWRLYKEGLQCRRKGDDVFELSRLDCEGRSMTAKPLRPAHTKFAKDFPHGAFRNALSDICHLRALIEVCSITRVYTESKLVDLSGKPVARIRHERVSSEGESGGELLSVLYIAPMKDCADEAEALCRELDARGLARLQATHDELRMALGAAGRSPDDYSSSFAAPVGLGMTCREAAAAILLKLIATMSRNVGGVLDDTDVEFLHDFRVASRRIRSAVSQIKHVFPEADAARMKRDFTAIGKRTNKLRDLDVLLMSRADCEDSIPEELRPGLESFFEEIEAHRRDEFSKLVSSLMSTRRSKTLKRWTEYLKTSSSLPRQANSDKPVEQLAGRFILKRLKRVLKSADRLDERSPDAEMHALRIECKKLRYLLEFFGPLFDSKGVGRLVGRLKRLQDFLGGLNDISVQSRFLSESLSRLSMKTSSSTIPAAALGALIARLYDRRRKLKGSFSKVFDKFLDSSEFEALEAVFKR